MVRTKADVVAQANEDPTKMSHRGLGKSNLAGLEGAKKISKSKRAGITFPASRIRRMLQKRIPHSRIAQGAPIYLASVLEYLTAGEKFLAEVVELGGNAARDNRKRRILPRHLLLAISNDEELNQLCHGMIIPGGGNTPNLRPELWKLKKKGRFVYQGKSYFKNYKEGLNETQMVDKPPQAGGSDEASKRKKKKADGDSNTAGPSQEF